MRLTPNTIQNHIEDDLRKALVDAKYFDMVDKPERYCDHINEDDRKTIHLVVDRILNPVWASGIATFDEVAQQLHEQVKDVVRKHDDKQSKDYRQWVVHEALCRLCPSHAVG